MLDNTKLLFNNSYLLCATKTMLTLTISNRSTNNLSLTLIMVDFLKWNIAKKIKALVKSFQKQKLASVNKRWQVKLGIIISCAFIQTYNRQQNELRHFTFFISLTSKGENIALPPPSPPCNIVQLLELHVPFEHNKHPNFEWTGQGRGVNSFVPWSYPIWEQCLCQQFCCWL